LWYEQYNILVRNVNALDKLHDLADCHFNLASYST